MKESTVTSATVLNDKQIKFVFTDGTEIIIPKTKKSMILDLCNRVELDEIDDKIEALSIERNKLLLMSRTK